MPDYRVTVALRVHDDNAEAARGRVQVALYQLARTGHTNLLELSHLGYGTFRGYAVQDDVTEGGIP
jgi:hypothetical protein